MPYSEGSLPKLVALALAALSFFKTVFDAVFAMLYPSMHLPRLDLHGKTAIVTGANSGIGFESARALAGMGARVVLACRNEARAQDAKRKILEDIGGDAVEVEVLDLGSFDSIRDFLGRWEKRESKRVDILINNAGKFFDLRI
jgi:retinol dehydrogenase-12